MDGDLERVTAALTAAGVTGVEDLGHFVNDTRYFRPSAFDERAAMPVWLSMLPSLTEPQAVETVAQHLHGPWARPAAFNPLLAAFRKWTKDEPLTGWAIGNAVPTAAAPERLTDLLDLAANPEYGMAQQMIVYALWRFKKDDRVAAALGQLINDPDVSVYAMSALRRTIGNERALDQLENMRDHHPDPHIRKQAGREVTKATKAIAKARA